MHPAIIIGTARSLIVDVAMGQIPRSTERISSYVNRTKVHEKMQKSTKREREKTKTKKAKKTYE